MTTQFFITAGVDLQRPVIGGLWRECAVEMGPFRTYSEAVSVAESLRGVPAQRILDHNPKSQLHDITDPDELQLPIVGTSIEYYDGDQTFATSILY